MRSSLANVGILVAIGAVSLAVIVTVSYVTQNII